MTSPNLDTSKLRELLERECAGYSNGRTSMDVELILQAADALRKQAEELERCRTALRPFALNFPTGNHLPDETRVMPLAQGGPRHEFCIGCAPEFTMRDLRLARSAYNEPKQNGEAK